METLEDGADGMSMLSCVLTMAEKCPLDKLTAKAQKITIKLPWEILTMYSDILLTDDEEDDDDIEAHEASIQRLKEADDATREMTREEYQHYSDCRQASFTYRKGEDTYIFNYRPD